MLLIINNINTRSICKQTLVVFECEKLIISKTKDTWGYLTEYFYILICFNNDEDLQRDIDEKLSLIQQTFIII